LKFTWKWNWNSNIINLLPI